MSELREVDVVPVAEYLPGGISDRISLYVERSLEKHTLNDDIVYEVLFNVTQQGPQAMIMFFMKGPLVGSMISGMSLIDNPPFVTEEEIEGAVKDLLEGLREERTKILSGVES